MSFDSSRRTVLKGIGVGTAALVGGAGIASAGPGSRGPPSEGKTILDVALELADGENESDFDIIVAAVGAAGLADALDGNRQLTVFVPTDDAFNAIGISLDDDDNLVVEDPAASLLANSSLTLGDILTYHISPGLRDATSVTSSKNLPTLNGAKIGVDGAVLNDGQATIVGPDAAQASNGIVHVINGVLLPPA